jgi:ParB family chromosome partitioning protein
VRGLLKAEPAAGKKKKRQAGRNGKAEVPDALRETLSAHRTAALRLELGRNPQLAFLALVHALVLRTFFGPAASACIDIRPAFVELGSLHEGLRESPAVKAFVEERQQLRESLPSEDALWSWLCEQDHDANLALLAHCVASSVNALWRRNGSGDHERLAQADVLASALGLDMAEWWRPTRVDYFDHVTRDGILGAVTEGVSKQAAENIAALKKGPMAARAEELLADKRWLPEPLRTPEAPRTAEAPKTAEA